jgi:hypothetical protein
MPCRLFILKIIFNQNNRINTRLNMTTIKFKIVVDPAFDDGGGNVGTV